MKSNVKLLIAAAVLLLLLAGAVIVLTLTSDTDSGENTEETTTAAETLSRLIYDKDPSKIDNIHIVNETGEYDIVKYSDDAWFVKEFIGVPHSTAAIQDILSCAATFTSQQVVMENTEDMSVYGLAVPRATVSIDIGDETKDLLIGSEAPTGGWTYVSFAGENTVHAVNTSEIDCYLKDKFSFIIKTVYTAKQPVDENDTTNYSKINKISISRKDIDYDIVLEYDVRQDDEEAIYGNSATHIMTEPVRLDLNPDASFDTINSVMGLTADEIAVIAPTDDMMKQFGLDDPFAEVNYDIVGGNFRMLIGNEYADENGKILGRYCYADGIDIIYMFGMSKLPWATIKPLDISMTMITSTYIFTIDNIDIECGDKKVNFELTGGQEDFSVTSDGKAIDTDLFKSYYQFILRAPAEELYLESNNSQSDIKITIAHEYGTDVIEFIKSEDRKTVIRLNGRTSFKCRSAYTDRLIENLEHLMNGEKLVETW